MDQVLSGASFTDTIDKLPFDFYDQARSSGGIVWDERANAWLITSLDFVRQAFKEHELFAYPFTLEHMNAATYLRRMRNDNPRPLQELQGAEHRALHRWWIMDLMAPSRIAEYRDQAITATIDGLIQNLAGKTSFDLVDDISERVPVSIFTSLIGLPGLSPEEIKRTKERLDDMANLTLMANQGRLEPGRTDPEAIATAEKGIASSKELDDLLLPAVRARRDDRRDDFISRLWNGGADVFPDWNETDMMDACKRLLFAGSDTTTHTIANAFHMLLTDAELMRQIREGDDETIGRFVEEVLRLNGSVHFRPRVLTADTEMGGEKLKKGDRAFLMLVAANRDPAAHACPYAVDLERPNPMAHSSFASGPRSCVGQSLAREELTGVVKAMLHAFPNLRLDPEKPAPKFLGYLFRSWRPLWVRVD